MGSERIELSEVISDIAAGPFGSNLKASTFVSCGFPIIDGANLKGYVVTDNITKFVSEEKARSLSRSIAKRGEVVVTISGTLGQIAYIPMHSAYSEYLCSQRQFRVAFDKSKVYVPYLVFYFHTFEGKSKLLSFANQTGVPALSQPIKNFKKIIVDLPDMRAQKCIASLIEAFNEKIALNNRINDYLAEYAEALYNRALVEATEASLTDVVKVMSGGTPKTKIAKYWEGGSIPFFGPGDVGASAYVVSTAKCITRLGLENCNSELYPIDTVFLTARGTVGKVAMAGAPMAMNQSCFAFRGKSISQATTYQIVKRAVRSLKAKANGATFAAINTRDLKIESIMLPSKEALDFFDEKAGWAHILMRTNEVESLRLAKLRDVLLPKLMSGEIDVSQADVTQLNNHLCDC